jgi:predicted extracellular nuclease
LYQPALLGPQGRFALLEDKLDPRFNDNLNRPALAQSFHVAGSGDVFTVVVTHLKSKNCSGAEGRNADQQNGQGCFNATRTLAANALADWALRDPTGSGSKQVLSGDFNSHRLEDRYGGGSAAWPPVAPGDALTYLRGAHQHPDAFASPQLLPFVTGAAPWHINADEPELLDYNIERGKPTAWFSSGPFRSSDHDPVIVGLDFAKPDLEE